MSNMRTIRVTSKGQIKVKPDISRITMSLEGTYPEYGETSRHSSEDTGRLKDIQNIDYIRIGTQRRTALMKSKSDCDYFLILY